jgi:hypothetical protein
VKVADLLASTPAYTDALAKQQSDATTDANNVQTDQAILTAANSKLATDRQNAPPVSAGLQLFRFGTGTIDVLGTVSNIGFTGATGPTTSTNQSTSSGGEITPTGLQDSEIAYALSNGILVPFGPAPATTT